MPAYRTIISPTEEYEPTKPVSIAEGVFIKSALGEESARISVARYKPEHILPFQRSCQPLFGSCSDNRRRSD